MNSGGSTSRRDQRRALGLSTLSFTLCFAAWTIFSILGIQIQEEWWLSDTQLGLLMATPILTGSISRLFLGFVTDRLGGRWVFGSVMIVSSLCIYLLSVVNSYWMLLVAALGVGLAGGSFIVGVAYTAIWYEQGKQGTALGIFGAGNVGAALTNFVAPLLLLALGWRGTAQVYAAVMLLMGVLFIVLARPDPQTQIRKSQKISWRAQIAPLGEMRVWRFSLYYFFVFGAFVALALWLPHYLMQTFGLSLVKAGLITACFTVPGSIFRILGGWLSDRHGARRVMYWTLIVSVICTFLLSYPPTEYLVQGADRQIAFSLSMPLALFTLIIVVLGFAMSLGKAAVFKHIPVYYPGHVGVVGGLVGMIGGLGGFFLPLTFGMLVDVVSIWQSCFMLLLMIAAAALIWMHYAVRSAEKQEWRQNKTVTDLPELSTPDALVLQDWRPEEPDFWESKGKKIAKRNLWISIPNLFLAFSVWSIWSILVVKMPSLGFSYTSNQLFWLAALPALSGATLRIFYSFMVPIFGGRRWTALSTASLIIPCLWLGFALQNTETSYLVMLILALLCGLGGGNFASSMANISFFFPKSEKGGALGLNAGLGNLGVSAMQLVAPLVIAGSVLGPPGGDALYVEHTGQPIWLQNAALVWVPLILAAALAAWFGMNDIASAKSSFRDQIVIFKRKHTWLMCWLYLGAFGSFIGFAAGFPLLSGMLFPAVDATRYAFIGPLVGALARPIGGIVADKFGGARVTVWMFALMIVGVQGVLYFLPKGSDEGSFWGFFVMFLVLFVGSGMLNGSTFRMVPVIFTTLRQRALGQTPQAETEGNRESAAVLGFSSAIAAYGGFFIPKAYGTSFDMTGDVKAALMGFVGFYLSCLLLTWWFYRRRGAEIVC